MLAGIVGMWSSPPPPQLTKIADGAALLYYSSPAGVRSGDQTAIGYITTDGRVEVAVVTGDGEIRYSTIHKYDTADDHGAPALWALADGFLIATAHHSSDMFLYRLGRDGLVSLLCHWTGRYTYPRFDQVAGKLRLYTRLEDLARGTIGAGDFGYLPIDESCRPAVLQYAAPPDHWIYAAPPSDGNAAWAYFSQIARKHTGFFVDGNPQPLVESAGLDENLPWSISGNLIAVTRFRDAFACCDTAGVMRTEIYRAGERIFAGRLQTAGLYPSGIVLSSDGLEGLFPMDGQINRQSVGWGLALPDCHLDGASIAQYIVGGEGAYVVATQGDGYSPTDFPASAVWLCD